MTQHYAALTAMNMPFTGAKLAILQSGRVMTILRDARVDIPFPAHWDLPGGGREGLETPLACVLRETKEELGLDLSVCDIHWARVYGSEPNRAWFFVSRVAHDLSGKVCFGNEGQRWQLMPIGGFMRHPRAVSHFQHRLRSYLQAPFPKRKAPRFV